jgi:hypothetical protein
MAFIFNRGALGLANGSINWASDTIRVRPSRTSENAINKDATTMTGLGVTGFDVTVTGKTGPTEDQTLDRIKYAFANFTFPAVTGAEVDKFIIFKFVTNDAGSTPIACCGLTPAITPAVPSSDISVTIDAAGAFFQQQ